MGFNDPFDCHPTIKKVNASFVIKNYKNILKDMAQASNKPYSSNKEMFAKELMQYCNSRESLSDLFKDTGMVCLSRKALSILMWSHYADFHKGFVLEYRIPIHQKGTREQAELAKERYLVPYKVNYKVQPSTFSAAQFCGLGGDQNFVEALYCTKSLKWAYEAEERAVVIDRNRPPGIYKYCRDEILTSVIAGLKTPSNVLDMLGEAVSNLNKSTIPNLKLYKVKSVEGDYKLLVPNHPRLNTGEPDEI